MTAVIPQGPLPPLVQLARGRRERAPGRSVEVTIDGAAVRVPEGATLLEACRAAGIPVPTLCFLETLHPVNACRVCVVELEGARVLVPACARACEPGMVVQTASARVRHARKMVLEFLASSVDLSATPDVAAWMAEYGCAPERYGPPAPAPEAARAHPHPGHHAPPDAEHAATVAQPPTIDNDLYVRDYAKCILCYKCVEACGVDHQNTFAIAVAGRGFDAHIATEFHVPLPGSACVYCGNCIAVCPTGALIPTTEFERRRRGTWDEASMDHVDTICPYCGVGCTLRLVVDGNEIVKAMSPLENAITLGNLCIKGRFGWRFVQRRAAPELGGTGTVAE